MQFSLRRHRWALAAPLLLLAPACGGDKKAGDDAAPDSAPAVTQGPPPPAPADTLTDGNIVAIVAASGHSEIAPSQAVVDRVQNAQVKQFAQLMITQHTALGDTVSQVAQQNNITPAPNAKSAQLDSITTDSVQAFRRLSGAELDRAFMHYMVTSHQGALDAVNQFIQKAQNPQLRNALQQNVLPIVQMHLAKADSLQAILGSP
jgi:putative membrane protein